MLADPELVAKFKASLANAGHDWRIVAVADAAPAETFTAGTVCLFSKPLTLQASVTIGAPCVLTLLGAPVVVDDTALIDDIVARVEAWIADQQTAAVGRLA